MQYLDRTLACGVLLFSACQAAAPAVGSGSVSTRLSEDVRWLADDAREGRRAGTEGERAAAAWIAERFDALGLEPAGSEGYLQAFEVPLPARDRGGSWIDVDGTRHEGADSVVPLTASAAGAFEGELGFYGFGIILPEADWNDYGDTRLDGGVALVVRGVPGETPEAPEGTGHDHDQNVVSSTGFESKASLFHKVMTAKQAGAGAVIVAQHPDAAGEPLPTFASGRELKVPLPALIVSAEVASALIPDYRLHVLRASERAAAEWNTTPTRPVSGFADVERANGSAHNVLARLAGTGSAGTVVIGAHFDHLGWGGSGSLAAGEVAIHNGADDNASGTAVVLELARVLAQDPPAGDVVFALWSGEELGLLGSEHWIEHPTVDLEGVVANINLDMVGRAGAGTLQVLGAGTSPAFADWMEAAGAASGLELEVSLSGNGLGGSDHQTFIKREIPALHLFSGLHGDYHKPSDDSEGFEAEGAARVAALALDLTRRLQATDALVFEAPKVDTERARGGRFAVRFGSIPDYAYDGQGLKLSGASAGSPAERAGLMAGDVIIQVGDIEVEDIYAFMYALQTYKPGDVVRTRYLRDGAEESVRVTLAAPNRE